MNVDETNPDPVEGTKPTDNVENTKKSVNAIKALDFPFPFWIKKAHKATKEKSAAAKVAVVENVKLSNLP